MKKASILLICCIVLLLWGCNRDESDGEDISQESESPSIVEPFSLPEASLPESSADDVIDSLEEAMELATPEESQPSSAPDPAPPVQQEEPPASSQSSVPEPPGSPAAPPASRSQDAAPEAPASSSQPESAPVQGHDSATDSSREPSSTLDTQLIEDELLRLINGERTAQGAGQLGREDTMRWAARIRAQEVVGGLSHTRPDGTSYYTVFDEVGFAYAGKGHGENAAYVHFTAGRYDEKEVAALMFQNLKDSSGHYSNMIRDSYSQVGIGAFVQPEGNTVKVTSIQLFAGL